jgi:hypothetical protein
MMRSLDRNVLSYCGFKCDFELRKKGFSQASEIVYFHNICVAMPTYFFINEYKKAESSFVQTIWKKL